MRPPEREGVCNVGNAMNSPDSEVPYGTLDLMVLKTLAGMGPLHGYGIARRIEQAAACGGWPFRLAWVSVQISRIAAPLS